MWAIPSYFEWENSPSSVLFTQSLTPAHADLIWQGCHHKLVNLELGVFCQRGAFFSQEVLLRSCKSETESPQRNYLRLYNVTFHIPNVRCNNGSKKKKKKAKQRESGGTSPTFFFGYRMSNCWTKVNRLCLPHLAVIQTVLCKLSLGPHTYTNENTGNII